MDTKIPQSVQWSTLRQQHSQLGDVNSAHQDNIDPEEGSDGPLNSINNTEDTKTQRDFNQSKADNVMGLRSYAPLLRCISSSGTEAFDMLSETYIDPFRDEKGVRKADDLFHVVSAIY